MTIFWILSAVMIIIALAIIAPSLLGNARKTAADRDRQNVLIARERLAELDEDRESGRISNEEHSAQQRELEDILLQDTSRDESLHTTLNTTRFGRAALLASVLLLPIASIVLYRQLGTPAMIDLQPIKQASAETTGSPHAGSMESMAVKLRQRLEQKTPNDGQGWFLLGRTYMTIRDYPSAVEAFEHSFRLMDNDPGAMLALADALSMTQQGRIHGRAAELVDKALALDPENTTAMWMGGLAAEDRGEYERALTLWKRLLPRFAGAEEEQQQLNRQIARVSMKAGLPVPQQPVLPAISDSTNQATAIPVGAGTQAKSSQLVLKVSLSPSLQQQAKADDTVFVYAKAMQGPRFPLAAVRYKVSELPLTITLDDSTAIMPTARLSDFSKVKVGARISPSGNAIAQRGDLVGEQANVQSGAATPINIVIDKVY